MSPERVPQEQGVRPLRQVRPGVWKSRDGVWTFMRHESDPHPKRWYAYEYDDASPANDGLGHTTLADAADWAERDAHRG